MPVIESSVEIAAGQADIFDLAQNYGLRLEWDPFLRAMRFQDGATEPAVGVRVWVRARNGLTMEVVSVTLDRPRNVAMKMVAGPRFFKHFAGSWRFDALGPGHTRVTFKYGFETRWLVLRSALNSIIERVFARDIARRLQGLKHAAEATNILERLRAGVKADDGIYSRLVGALWDELPRAFCAVHAPGEATGTLSVTRGSAAAARAVAWICGLPREAQFTPLALRVEQDGASQIWRRRFGDTLIVTRQHATAGTLREQFGLLELTFRLLATQQALRFDQRAAALVLGPLRLPWPSSLAPRVTAEVRPLDSGAAIEVEVRAPLCGLILRYAGNVHPCETQ